MESNSNTFVSFEQEFGADGLKKGHLNLIVEDTHFELSPDDAEALLVQLAAACTEMRRSEEDETAYEFRRWAENEIVANFNFTLSETEMFETVRKAVSRSLNREEILYYLSAYCRKNRIAMSLKPVGQKNFYVFRPIFDIDKPICRDE